MMTRLSLRAALLLCLAVGGCARGPEFYPEPAGHRADRQAGTENSRTAILGALSNQLGYLEVDLRRTADGAIVLQHDNKLHHRLLPIDQPENTPIKNLTLAELRQAPVRGGGGFILTYTDALQMIAGRPGSFLLDVKGMDQAFLDEIVATARTLNAASNITIQCQEIRCLRYLRAAYPKVKVLARAHSPADVGPMMELKPQILQMDAEWATPELVKAIHMQGSKILMKALDDDLDNRRGWRKLRRLGADIALTDFPETLGYSASVTGGNPKRSSSISSGF